MIWILVIIAAVYVAGLAASMVYLKWCADQTLFWRPTLWQLFVASLLWPLEVARAFFGR